LFAIPLRFSAISGGSRGKELTGRSTRRVEKRRREQKS
jgi:hypothetical protein